MRYIRYSRSLKTLYQNYLLINWIILIDLIPEVLYLIHIFEIQHKAFSSAIRVVRQFVYSGKVS